MFATIIAEQNADNIFTEYCDAKTAGNALTKIVLNDDFMRELPRYLKAEELYGEPEPVGNYLGIVTALFRKKFPERMEFWIDLHKKELLPNVSSHPLLRDRLAKIGVSLDDVTPELPGNDPSGSEAEYRAECAKAITYCDGRIFEQQKNSYLEDRRRSYLDPLKRIREWERGGRQLTPDTFKQICADLDALGRFEEEEELKPEEKPVIKEVEWKSIEEGFDVKMSEIHGMSQRGGTVVTQIKYGEKVYSPIIGEGEADLIVSFEKKSQVV